MDLSVVFATYKSEDILEKSLKAYCNINTNYQWELIIIDNADSAETRELIANYNDKLPIHFIEKSKPGKNNALNLALPLVKGDLIFFTDNDVIFAEDTIDIVIEAAKSNSDYDIFTGKILPNIDLPTWIDQSSHRIKSAFVINDPGEKNKQCYLEDVWGPNMIVRSKLFHGDIQFNPNVGPQGKDYVMGSETELLKRFERSGHKALYLAGNKVYHQIRDEQLTLNWLGSRAFRSGKGAAFNNNDSAVKLFGVPRYLLKKLVLDYCRNVQTSIYGDKRLKCLTSMEYNFTKGKVFQARRQLENS
tara:strand:- start:105 stop:1013 length:909 start_codon:yes stop_codon:yes gene_type:complete